MPKAPSRAKTTIQPGDLRRPITLLKRTDVTTKTGGAKPTYTPVLSSPLWALDEYKNAKTADQAGKLITTAFHRYTVRFNPIVVDGLYIRDPNYPQLMYIQGVGDPDGSRAWMQLSVTDVE